MPSSAGTGAGATSAPATRALVVDKHEMVARSLGLALDDVDGLEVVGTACSGREGLRMAARLQPDVVVIDRRLDDCDGLEVARPLRDLSPGTRVVMLAASPDERAVAQAIDAGCSGLVAKSGTLDELVTAIRTAAQGRTWFHAEPAPPEGGAPLLSARELQVLRRVADGVGTTTIADELGLSVHTARNHVRNLMTKLGAHSRVEAVVLATRLGLIELSDPP